VIGLPWQGFGFASEAAQALVRWLEGRGIRTITAHVHPDHHASSSVASASRGIFSKRDSRSDSSLRWTR